MFRQIQQICDKYPHTANLPEGSELPLIIDFSLTQSSLEQVFLRLAEKSHEETPPPTGTATNFFLRSRWDFLDRAP